jgi:type VI secretion system protein ImpJ
MASTNSDQNSTPAAMGYQDQFIFKQRLARPICWHEGMLLSPQHFQQNHLYWETQMRTLMALLAPDYWGIGRLEYAPDTLPEGIVTIERLVAVMPDGLVIDYDAKTDEPLTLALEGVAENETVLVHLAVPIQVPGSASDRTEIRRYISRDDSPRIDENTGDNELVMPRLHPLLSLIAADRVGSRFVGLPLFRVTRPAGGNFQLDPDYAPALLSLGADEFRVGLDDSPGLQPLQQMCMSLAITIRHKARQLAGWSEEGESLGRTISKRHHRWIRAMVQELPGFELLADVGTSRPAQLYQALVRMAGPISELSSDNIPPIFPPYRHDNMLPGFKLVIGYIREQVETVNLHFTSLRFDEEREGVFTLKYDKAWEGKDLLIELKPAQKGSRESGISWLGASRIASESAHVKLQERRILGVEAKEIEGDEKSGIVPAPGNVLFRIKADRKYIYPGTLLKVVCTDGKLKAEQPQALLLHMPHESEQ